MMHGALASRGDAGGGSGPCPALPSGDADATVHSRRRCGRWRRRVEVGEEATLQANSSRRRRLVHFVADGLGFHHASVAGEQNGGRAHFGAVRVRRL